MSGTTRVGLNHVPGEPGNKELSIAVEVNGEEYSIHTSPATYNALASTRKLAAALAAHFGLPSFVEVRQDGYGETLTETLNAEQLPADSPQTLLDRKGETIARYERVVMNAALKTLPKDQPIVKVKRTRL